MKTNLLYLDFNQERIAAFTAAHSDEFQIYSFTTIAELTTWFYVNFYQVDVVLSSGNIRSREGIQLIKTLGLINSRKSVPFMFAASEFSYSEKKMAVESGVVGIFLYENLLAPEFAQNLKSILNNKRQKQDQKTRAKQIRHKIPVPKRIFDILFSLAALVILSPLLLLITIGLVIADGFPVIYVSKRVGAGYNVFNFYKFRTMIKNADAKINQLKHLNQYNTDPVSNANDTVFGFKLCKECQASGEGCQRKLYLDTGLICEKDYLQQKSNPGANTFVKLQSDPRITRFGRFLRDYSFDELPQLFNVLKGDMSLVGNRPLPIYEAEKLTTDEKIKRFVAPAGITGLWQVTKRGKKEMSAEERIALDNYYSENYSLLTDIRIILKTFPAVIQKENV